MIDQPFTLPEYFSTDHELGRHLTHFTPSDDIIRHLESTETPYNWQKAFEELSSNVGKQISAAETLTGSTVERVTGVAK